jgi:hypothetical protein
VGGGGPQCLVYVIAVPFGLIGGTLALLTLVRRRNTGRRAAGASPTAAMALGDAT